MSVHSDPWIPNFEYFEHLAFNIHTNFLHGHNIYNCMSLGAGTGSATKDALPSDSDSALKYMGKRRTSSQRTKETRYSVHLERSYCKHEPYGEGENVVQFCVECFLESWMVVYLNHISLLRFGRNMSNCQLHNLFQERDLCGEPSL